MVPGDRPQRVLIAAQPAALAELKPVLDPALELVYVTKTADAVRELQGGGIDAIVCTIAFDESRMIEFLQLVKASPDTRAIPFVCTRVLRGALSDHLVDRLGIACKECGADFLDLATIAQPEAISALRAALGSTPA